jgi:hypothetical protein
MCSSKENSQRSNFRRHFESQKKDSKDKKEVNFVPNVVEEYGK